MKKSIILSLTTISMLFAENVVNIDEIQVTEEKINTTIVKNVSKEEIKSADLAESLTKHVPSVSIVRRSGIANDIILRGAKKDNINILVDDSKIYGACPNRMDPATSHVLTNNIEKVTVIEGPYDVENFGTLSGLVKVETKKPTKDFAGDINLNMGSFGYKKGSFTVSGGNDYIKLLLSASMEKSDQYEDGNGNDFYEQQVANGIAASSNPMVSGRLYSSSYQDAEAYEKKTLLTKAIVNIDDSSELNLSLNLNRSDNVLYPNTPMDAAYDDSDIYTISYTKRNLGNYSKELNVEYYYSKVDHPMDTAFRVVANGGTVVTNHMNSSIWGSRIKNSMDIADSVLTYGLDTSVRNWKGQMLSTTGGVTTVTSTSLASTDTKNKALFTTLEKSFGALDIEAGIRYDDTNIDNVNSAKTNRKYNALNGNIFAVYNLDNETKIFAGVGKSSRVPDARELYYGATNNNLEDTKNYEVDLGFEKSFGDLFIKTKFFYSKLEDYIYNASGFENIDASIYGAEVSGFYLITEDMILDYGLSYLKGKKDGSYSDKDLAEIPPLKANLSLSYDFGPSVLTTQLIASKGWSSYDSTAGEQDLGGYTVLNTKYNHNISRNFDVTLGIDNILDKTYTSTNTYNDIKYIGSGDTELLNDPGRYFYINLKYTF